MYHRSDYYIAYDYFIAFVCCYYFFTLLKTVRVNFDTELVRHCQSNQKENQLL